MARPQEKGLRYFPFDVDFFSDRKIKVLFGRYGADGITVYIYLLTEIYRENGYFLKKEEDFYYIVSADLNMSSDKIEQIIEFLCERSMFDKQLFVSDDVLTSRSIQRRFQEAVSEKGKKTPIEIDENIWLLDEEETKSYVKCMKKYNSSPKNKGYSLKNKGYSREKLNKEKESKLNKNKLNENKLNEKEEKDAYGKYSHVTLTPEEYDLLIHDYNDDASAIINFLDEKIEANGYSYNNCYLKIKEWAADAYLNEVKPKLEKQELEKRLNKLAEEAHTSLTEEKRNEILKKYGKYLPKKQEENLC